MRDAGATGKLTLRADSGFYTGAVIAACRRHKVAFSVTARKNTAIQRAIDAIPQDAWTPIPYWLDGGADVAETTYTAFTGRHKTTTRLIVRRVRPTPGSQLALDVAFSYHAIITDRTGPMLEVEADHRRHAIVEHTICDLKHHAGLAHLPSGKFTANAVWLALVGIAYNLARWTSQAAGLGRVTTKTLRLTIIAAPARLVTSARRLRLRLPTDWPWADTSTAPCTSSVASIPRPADRTTRANPAVRHDPITTSHLDVPPGHVNQPSQRIRPGPEQRTNPITATSLCFARGETTTNQSPVHPGLATAWDADVAGADLDGADLDGANLDGADLDGANVTRVCYNDEWTAWPAGFTPPDSVSEGWGNIEDWVPS